MRSKRTRSCGGFRRTPCGLHGGGLTWSRKWWAWKRGSCRGRRRRAGGGRGAARPNRNRQLSVQRWMRGGRRRRSWVHWLRGGGFVECRRWWWWLVFDTEGNSLTSFICAGTNNVQRLMSCASFGLKSSLVRSIKLTSWCPGRFWDEIKFFPPVVEAMGFQRSPFWTSTCFYCHNLNRSSCMIHSIIHKKPDWLDIDRRIISWILVYEMHGLIMSS